MLRGVVIKAFVMLSEIVVAAVRNMQRTIVMGTVFAVALFAFLASSSGTASAAQTVPYKVNFQGRLANSAGNIMPDGLYNIKFRIWTAASGGTNTWTETRETTNRVQVTNGLFSVQLGDVTALSPSLFTTQPIYFEVELPTTATATCGTASCAVFNGTEVMTPRSPFGAAPYAMNSDTIDGIDSDALVQLSPGVQQTGFINISGNITGGGALQTASATLTGTGSLTIGTANSAAGSIAIRSGTTAFTATVVSGATAANYSIALPTNGATGVKCLQSTSGSTAAVTALEFATCASGGASSLQAAYDGGNAIALGANGVLVRDNATPLSRAFAVQNSGATFDYFAVSSTGLSVQRSAGVTALSYVLSDGTLRVYETAGSNYASISYSGGSAIFAASSGVTQVGNGTGSISMNLSAAAAQLNVVKTLSTGAYTSSDYNFTRNLTGSSTITGSLFNITDNSTSTGINSSVLANFNQNQAAATGNLLQLQKAGANQFAVGTSGSVTMNGAITAAATGNTINGLVINGGSLTSVGANITGTAALTLASGSTNALLTLQSGSLGTAKLVVDSSTNRITLGVSDNIGMLLVLDTKTDAGDPVGTNGAMYYNGNLNKFRCYEAGAWIDCISGGSTSKFLGKPAAESVISSTVLQNDDNLSFTIGPNEIWAFDFRLLVANNSSAGPDWKAAILAPNSASCNVTMSGTEPAGTAFPQMSTTNCLTNTGLLNTVIVADVDAFNVSMQGRVTAGASGGTVTLQWAQNTATAVNLDVRGGSYVIAQKVN